MMMIRRFLERILNSPQSVPVKQVGLDMSSECQRRKHCGSKGSWQTFPDVWAGNRKTPHAQSFRHPWPRQWVLPFRGFATCCALEGTDNEVGATDIKYRHAPYQSSKWGIYLRSLWTECCRCCCYSAKSRCRLDKGRQNMLTGSRGHKHPQSWLRGT